MDVGHRHAPIGKRTIRVFFLRRRESRVSAFEGHVVHQREATRHEGLRRFGAGDRKLNGSEFCAVGVWLFGHQSVRRNHHEA